MSESGCTILLLGDLQSLLPQFRRLLRDPRAREPRSGAPPIVAMSGGRIVLLQVIPGVDEAVCGEGGPRNPKSPLLIHQG